MLPDSLVIVHPSGAAVDGVGGGPGTEGGGIGGRPPGAPGRVVPVEARRRRLCGRWESTRGPPPPGGPW
jgi:hypothetical protein